MLITHQFERLDIDLPIRLVYEQHKTNIQLPVNVKMQHPTSKKDMLFHRVGWVFDRAFYFQT